jgi:hypothetical protein
MRNHVYIYVFSCNISTLQQLIFDHPESKVIHPDKLLLEMGFGWF